MRITFDQTKRDQTFAQRGIAFEDALLVFRGRTFDFEDKRENYGEHRYISYGYLMDRMVVICFTPRGADRHIISMRKANDREQKKIEPFI